MRIQTNETSKTVTIWLSRQDQESPECAALLDPFIRALKTGKYLPVIFRSGHDDLCDTAAGLLLHNRDAAVRRELAEEKAARH